MARLQRNSATPTRLLPLALWAWLLITTLAQAQPVILHLLNGDRVSGDLVTEDPSRITLTNAILGRFSIPLTAVARRDGVTNLAVAKSSAPVATDPPPPALPPALQSKLNDLQTVHVTGNISAEEYQWQRARLLSPPKPPGPKHWSAELYAGLDLAFSQKDRQLYTGRMKLNYARAPLRNNIDYLFTYGWADGVLSANRMDGWMKTDLDLTPRTYLYSLEGAGYDEIRQVNWRYEVGPGVGYHLIKRTNLVVRVEAGFNYQVQNIEEIPLKRPAFDREEKRYSQRLAQDFRWNIGSQFTFDEKVEYFPELTDLHTYRMRVEANLRYWLKSNLSLNFTVIDTYETQTSTGVGQNDLQLRSSIGVKF